VCAVPDLIEGQGVAGFTVPNAQHAVRQGKLMARNLTAVLRGEEPREYRHRNQGAVAGFGLYEGVFQSGPIAVKGLIAWFMHRGYHGFAMPMWERKIRVFGEWIINFLTRRDLVGIPSRDTPRAAFEEFAARPKAAGAAAPVAQPVAQPTAQPVAQPAAQSVARPATQPVAEPARR
jgi:NADH dehydrogenase